MSVEHGQDQTARTLNPTSAPTRARSAQELARMRLRRLEIERFRGIKSLDWIIGGDFVCLVGPGDSTKTTILDAIEYALSPRWNIPFDDTDFYDADTTLPFTITVTVGDLPSELTSDRKFGHQLRGWLAPSTLHDEPEEKDELVLSIRLTVPASLEPTWAVVNGRVPDGVRIGADDREKLGCTRLGEFLDRHFSWARGTIVTRLTGTGTSITGIMADATRAARATLANEPTGLLKPFHDAAGSAEKLGKSLGVSPRASYRAQLDTLGVSVGSSGLSIHDGSIPIRRAGLGTRRLLAVAIQRELARTDGLTLIDEVEEGLEPHRLRHLLRELRDDPNDQKRHVIMTTHAPVALGELEATELRVVRSEAGITRVLSVDKSLQPIVRKSSEAFLATKVLVCEGSTELGLCRRLDRWWSDSGNSFALAGIALTDGGGGRTEAPKAAQTLADLGYATAYLGDSDEPLDPTAEALEAAGCKVLVWEGKLAIEDRVAADLPWAGVAALVRLAMKLHGDDCIRDAVAQRAELKPSALPGDPFGWLNDQITEAELRRAIAVSARKHKPAGSREGWFKRVDLAEELAGIVIDHWETLKGKDLRLKLEQLQAWAHGT